MGIRDGIGNIIQAGTPTNSALASTRPMSVNERFAHDHGVRYSPEVAGETAVERRNRLLRNRYHMNEAQEDLLRRANQETEDEARSEGYDGSQISAVEGLGYPRHPAGVLYSTAPTLERRRRMNDNPPTEPMMLQDGGMLYLLS